MMMRSVTTIERNGSQVTIKTDNRPRKLWSWYDLPIEYQADFDYVQDDDHDSTVPGLPWHGRSDMFPGWDSYIGDSFFSGVLFRYVPGTDYEEVVVGRYYC